MVSQGDTTPDVTIVIRARNEEKLLPRCLQMIFCQDTVFTFEVLVIDSGSSDRTVSTARQFAGVTVLEIEPESFNYGATLNLGVRLAKGRYVAALSAHCVPIDGHWLQRLVEPLERIPGLGGSFGRQIPWPECEPVERAALQTTFGENDFVRTGPSREGDVFEHVFSNASSCIRRDLALAIPFRALPWAEDRVWAHAVLRAGYGIAYASRSVVYHSHQRSVAGYLRLGYLDGKAQALFGRLPMSLGTCSWFGVRPFWWTLRRWRKVCAKQGVPASRIFVAAVGSVARQIALDLGTWVGQRSVHRDRARTHR